MTRIARSISWLALLVLAAAASAQPPEPPFMAELFPPDLIMRYGRDIGLTSEQRAAITKAVSGTQAQTLEFQWDMQDAARLLGELLRPERVDERAALAAATRVMELEQKVKRSHLALVIRIKNQLTAAQQGQLRKLRQQSEERH